MNIQNINLDLLCDFEKCLGNLCQLTINNIESRVSLRDFILISYKLINKNLDNIDSLTNLLESKNIIDTAEKSGENLEELFIDNILTNIGDLELNNFTEGYEEFNKFIDIIPNRLCKLNVIDENNRIEYIKYRIIEEILRNNYSRSQIFDNFKQVNLDEKFKFNKETEIIISHKDLKDKNILNNLYIILKKHYYRNITSFDEMEYKINLDLIMNSTISSRFC